jgi:hypothetical protein
VKLKKLISRIADKIDPPPPPPYKPVDLSGVLGGLHLMSAARHDGHKRPGESVLTGYARASGYRDEAELCRVAFNDGPEFERRYLAHIVTSHDPHVIGVHRNDYLPNLRKAVVTRFVVEEACHQLLDEALPWWTERPGLSEARPCGAKESQNLEVSQHSN